MIGADDPSRGTTQPRRPAAASLVVVAFAIALSATAVLYPLLALDAGFNPAAVGLFTSVSASAQLVVRLGLPRLLARLPDRSLVAAGCLLLVGSALVLLAWTSAAAFLLAQVAQGSGRALFWTASQTHAARSPGVRVQQLARVQVASNIGGLVGPVVAGALGSRSLAVGLALPVVVATAGAVGTLRMPRLDPYQRDPRSARQGAWRRSARSLGNWTSFSGGGWRGLMDSFVPVVLASAGLGVGTIGWLVSVADGAPLAASAALARWGSDRLRRLTVVTSSGMLTSALLLPLVAGTPLVAAIVLAIGGTAGGFATTLGSAIASGEGPASQQGTAIAAAGAYRAGARMTVPSAVGTLGSGIGIGAAMGVAAAVMVAPVLGLVGRSGTGEDHDVEDGRDARMEAG